MADSIDFANWSCPLPLRDYPAIVMGHGGGGKLSAELIESLFLPAFANTALQQLGDAAIVAASGGRMAMSTDAYVVKPLFFPGGNIGELAVNGTVNDLAMTGATPLYLSASFIIEEGLPMAQLGVIVDSMAAAARAAGVQIITGDTKVVDKGHGDGVFITTAGVGVLKPHVNIAAQRAQPGDAIIINGPIGNHGMAIMSVREGLEFESPIASDTAALNGLVAAMLATGADLHTLRDATRGGVATVLNEVARTANVGVEYNEAALPVDPAVQAACDMLGMDPVYVANEGKLVAFVPATQAEAVLAVMRAHPLGTRAAIIGRAVQSHPGRVVARTAIGGQRVVDTQIGEQLPRIC